MPSYLVAPCIGQIVQLCLWFALNWIVYGFKVQQGFTLQSVPGVTSELIDLLNRWSSELLETKGTRRGQIGFLVNTFISDLCMLKRSTLLSLQLRRSSNNSITILFVSNFIIMGKFQMTIISFYG